MNRKGRVRPTEHLGLVVGDDCQRRAGNGHRSINKAEHVIGRAETAQSRGDGVAAHRAGRRRRGRQAGSAAQDTGRVAVDKAAVAGGEGGIGRAINLALGVGGDRQRRWRHRQRAGDVVDRIVGHQAARAAVMV